MSIRLYYPQRKYWLLLGAAGLLTVIGGNLFFASTPVSIIGLIAVITGLIGAWINSTDAQVLIHDTLQIFRPLEDDDL